MCVTYVVYYSVDTWWVGLRLSCNSNPDSREWRYGVSGAVATYIEWWGGTPGVSNGASLDCLRMRQADKYLVTEANCTAPYAYICESKYYIIIGWGIIAYLDDS